MKRYFLIPVLVLLTCSGWVYGQSSPNYQVEMGILSGGGGLGKSVNYDLWSTLWQSSAIGISSSSQYGAYGGFGYIIASFAESTPEEQIARILEFFDDSVEAGTLYGIGPGKSAMNRLNALRNMIEEAGDLIEDGNILGTCQQLMDAYKKTDGNPKPPDFVAGAATSELASMIQELMVSLGCQ